MADRYWVGGTGTWNFTSTTNWSSTDGGASGASVPTSSDNVFFTSLSGSGTVTVGTGIGSTLLCQNLNFSGFTGTLAGVDNIGCYGNLTFSSTMTLSFTGQISLYPASGSYTIQTNGLSLQSIVQIGSGTSNPTYTLLDSLTTSKDFNLYSGTFNTNNYNLTASRFLSSTSQVRTINLGSSTVTLTGANSFSTATQANLTFNAGTSTIVCSANGTNFQTETSLTFYNVYFSGSPTTINLIGSNVFNDLKFEARSLTVGIGNITFYNSQTINGTLTINSVGDPTYRLFFKSNTMGTQITLTCNAVASGLADADFRDIAIAGNAISGGNITGSGIGDCKGNSGITFPAARTVYYASSTAQAWHIGGIWSLSNNGVGVFGVFPLAQDTAYFPNAYPTSGSVGISYAYNIGTVDMSNRTTGTMTLSVANNPSIYGDWKNGTGTTLSSTGTLTFSGRNTQTITSAGKTFTQLFVINSPSGTVTLADALTVSGTSFTLTMGTFDASTYSVTLSSTSASFISSGTITRTLNMGSGLWTIAGGSTVWDCTTSTNMTLNKGTADILLSSTASVNRNLRLANFSYNKITIGGTTGASFTNIYGSFSCTELASTKTVAHTISFDTTGTKTIGSWTVKGTLGNVVTVNSLTVGTQATINLLNTTTGTNYLAVKDINIVNPNLFYVGANSTDNGNNTNVIFQSPPAPPSSGASFFLMF